MHTRILTWIAIVVVVVVVGGKMFSITSIHYGYYENEVKEKLVYYGMVCRKGGSLVVGVGIPTYHDTLSLLVFHDSRTSHRQLVQIYQFIIKLFHFTARVGVALRSCTYLCL